MSASQRYAILAGTGTLGTEADWSRLSRVAAGEPRTAALRSLVASRRAENDEAAALFAALDRDDRSYIDLDDAITAASMILPAPPSRALRLALAMAFIELESRSTSDGRVDLAAWRSFLSSGSSAPKVNESVYSRA